MENQSSKTVGWMCLVVVADPENRWNLGGRKVVQKGKGGSERWGSAQRLGEERKSQPGAHTEQGLQPQDRGYRGPAARSQFGLGAPS